MKKWKKAILTMLCLGVILGTVACGNNGDANDDAANDTPTEQNDTNNDVTDGDDKEDKGGVIDDVGDAIGDGMNNVGDGIKDMTDTVTGDKNNNR